MKSDWLIDRIIVPLTFLVELKLNLELNLEQKHHSKPYIKLVIALQ